MPHEVTILAYKIEQDPWFTSVAQPVLRWAREVWVVSTDMHKRPGDALRFTELEQTAEKIYEITGKDPGVARSRGMEKQDPIRATAAGLTELGWDIKSHRYIKNHKGEEFDLYFATPAMLKHKIAERMDDIRWERAQAVLKCQCLGDVNRELVQPILRSKKIGSATKSMILCLFNLAVPTDEWLNTYI